MFFFFFLLITSLGFYFKFFLPFIKYLFHYIIYNLFLQELLFLIVKFTIAGLSFNIARYDSL